MAAISFLPFLQTVPWGTRALTALLLAASILQFALASVVRKQSAILPAFGHELPWLVLLPERSWKFPWTLLSAGFVELHIVEVSLTARYPRKETDIGSWCCLWLQCRWLAATWSACGVPENSGGSA